MMVCTGSFVSPLAHFGDLLQTGIDGIGGLGDGHDVAHVYLALAGWPTLHIGVPRGAAGQDLDESGRAWCELGDAPQRGVGALAGPTLREYAHCVARYRLHADEVHGFGVVALEHKSEVTLRPGAACNL